jgi:hypothetical protein
MKNKFYISLLLSAMLVGGFISCSDDFLDGVQTDVIRDSQIQQGDPVRSARALLDGAYKNLFNPTANILRTSHDDFGLRAIQLATDLMADDFVLLAPSAGGGWCRFDYENDNRLLNYRRPTNTWRQLYNLILSTNDALRILERIETSSAALDRVEGELRGMRAFSYFKLINLYQQPYNVNKNAPGIPIRDIDISKPGRNTVSEVYDLILSDLFLAYDLLEGKGMSSAVALSEYSVAGMLARVLSFVNDYPNQWQEVAKFAGIAAQGAPLMNTQAQFRSGLNSITVPEVLWGSSINAETTTFFASFFSHLDPFGSGYGGDLGSFKGVTSVLYDKMDPADLRLSWFSDGTSAIYDRRPYSTAGLQGVLPKYASLKFTEFSRRNFTADYIYMRSSEFFYVQAEALFFAGNEGGARTALETVMKTRIEGYSAAALSGTALLNEIRFHKRIDTWGDGVRLFDMKWRGEAMDRTGTNHAVVAIMKLDPNPMEWIFQIPQAEMDANDAITVNNP